MKKMRVLALVLLVLAGASLWAEKGPLGLTGIGVYGSMGSTAGKLGGGTGLTLKWGSFPVIGLQYDFAASKVNVSCDYYVIDAEAIGSSFSYFVAGGAYAGIGAAGFDAGLRIPVGIQFWPIKKLELFLSPVATIGLIPSVSVGFGGEFGARLHF